MPAPIKDIDEQDPMCHLAKVGSIAQLNLIEGIVLDPKNSLTVITTLPNGKSGSVELMKGVRATVIANWRSKSFGLFLLSLIPRSIVALFSELRALVAARKEEVIVITLNTTLPFSLPVLLAKLYYKKLLWCPFLVDSIEYPHYDKVLLFRLANRFSAWAAKRADASITLNIPNAVDYITNKPYHELFFSVSKPDMDIYATEQPAKNKKFTIAYLGALTDIYNMNSIIKTIQKSGDKYRWLFAGYGPNQASIEALAQDNKYDVMYLGVLSHDESIELQRSADLLLCLRLAGGSKINSYTAKYSASGKLSEYLCSGKPILAGDIPAFSDQMKQYMTCISDQSAENIENEINKIFKDYDKKLELAKRGKEFAFRACDPINQGLEVNKFLQSLVRG